MARTRTERLGPAARPVVVPEDFGDSSVSKAGGEVELPPRIRWSGPAISYDLNDRADRARVYEQVLREGTERDISYYVDEEQLRDLFDELVLPPAVQREWAGWLRRHAQVLSPLQRQVAQIIAGLEEAEEFALAGARR